MTGKSMRELCEWDEHATAALESGALTRSGDEHSSWTPGDFDEAGWAGATELMVQTLERLTAIHEKSAERLGAERGSACVRNRWDSRL